MDHTLIRDNLRLSVEQEFEKLIWLQEFAEELRCAKLSVASKRKSGGVLINFSDSSHRRLRYADDHSRLSDAIEHLPEGATLRLAGISWDEYEELLSELGDHAGLRISYDEGEMHILSPTAEHEEYKDSILCLARLLADGQIRSWKPEDQPPTGADAR
ncbi:MAG TPA: hypothetical protein VM943_04545 [Pyrinomonadaceae bacterium]|nr:hypothetical protein [Pyrinomonadaceae bacterium]